MSDADLGDAQLGQLRLGGASQDFAGENDLLTNVGISTPRVSTSRDMPPRALRFISNVGIVTPVLLSRDLRFVDNIGLSPLGVTARALRFIDNTCLPEENVVYDSEVGSGSQGGVSPANAVRTITVPGNVTAGKGLVLSAFLGNATVTLSSVSDSRGNTWVVDRSQIGGNGSAAVASTQMPTALQNGDTITVTYPSPLGTTVVFSWILIATSVPVAADQTTSQQGILGTNSSLTTPAKLRAINELAIFASVSNGATLPTYTAGGSATMIDTFANGTVISVAMEYHNLTGASAATDTESITRSLGTQASNIIVTYYGVQSYTIDDFGTLGFGGQQSYSTQHIDESIGTPVGISDSLTVQGTAAFAGDKTIANPGDKNASSSASSSHSLGETIYKGAIDALINRGYAFINQASQGLGTDEMFDLDSETVGGSDFGVLSGLFDDFLANVSNPPWTRLGGGISVSGGFISATNTGSALQVVRVVQAPLPDMEVFWKMGTEPTSFQGVFARCSASVVTNSFALLAAFTSGNKVLRLSIQGGATLGEWAIPWATGDTIGMKVFGPLIQVTWFDSSAGTWNYVGEVISFATTPGTSSGLTCSNSTTGGSIDSWWGGNTDEFHNVGTQSGTNIISEAVVNTAVSQQGIFEIAGPVVYDTLDNVGTSTQGGTTWAEADGTAQNVGSGSQDDVAQNDVLRNTGSSTQVIVDVALGSISESFSNAATDTPNILDGTEDAQSSGSGTGSPSGEKIADSTTQNTGTGSFVASEPGAGETDTLDSSQSSTQSISESIGINEDARNSQVFSNPYLIADPGDTYDIHQTSTQVIIEFLDAELNAAVSTQTILEDFLTDGKQKEVLRVVFTSSQSLLEEPSPSVEAVKNRGTASFSMIEPQVFDILVNVCVSTQTESGRVDNAVPVSDTLNATDGASPIPLGSSNVSGVNIPSILETSVIHITDTTPPTIDASFGLDSTLIVVISETLDQSFVPSPSDFIVTINGVQHDVIAVYLNNNQIILVVDGWFEPGETGTVCYTGSTVRDVAGNLLPDLCVAITMGPWPPSQGGGGGTIPSYGARGVSMNCIGYRVRS